MYDVTTETAPFDVQRLLLGQVVFYHVEYSEIWQKTQD